MKRSSIAALGLLLGLAAPALLPAQTIQNFQTGTSYVPAQNGTSTGPATMAGGPTGGNFLRLLAGAGTAGINAIAFNRTDTGGFTQIVADFDFRMNPGTGQGLGFALLNTATYEKYAAVAATGGEEPNFTGSLGIGFDPVADGGASDNHVSVHFNNVRLTQVDTGIALVVNDWIHAHLVVRPGGGNTDVSVTLTPLSTGVPVAVLTNYVVPGLEPYESRAYFAARRLAADTANHDLANINVQFTADPALLGQWGGMLTYPIIPIHSTLLPNGKIICWDRNAGPTTDTIPRLIDTASLDIPAGNVNLVAATHPGVEIFCSSHTLLADGRLFVAGGHNGSDGNGLDTAFTYDGWTNIWTPVPPMLTGGRWYPTVTLLANGDPIVFSGSKTGGGANLKVQIREFGSGTWKTVGPDKSLSQFPYMHLAPNGKIFHSGPEQGTEYLDTTTGIWTAVATRKKGFRDYGASVLYDTGKVLTLGGGTFEAGGTPSRTAEVIDLTTPSPSWRLVPTMAYTRRQCNALLLPDGTVLVTGGTSSGGFSESVGSVHAPELWDPVSETFRTVAGMALDRLYHSETLLLPDGRVLSQGGGHPGPPEQFNGEVYSPPYLFKGPRPALTAAPSRVVYGEVFQVTSADAPSIDAVSLIALTSVTHTNNFSQRILRPSFAIGGGTLDLTTPSDPNLCPPGPYLLFLLRAGVPSVAKVILVNHNQPPVAVSGGAITTEAVDANGATVQFNGGGSTDPDNNLTTYEWYEGMNLLATGVSPMVTLIPGAHTITLKVIDAGALSSTTTFTVNIQDTTPPVIQTLSATPQLLRAVNNQLVSVTLSATATDTVDPAPTTQATLVTSTESANGLFAGDLTPDWQFPGGMTVQLRAERYAILRRYTVTAGATDSQGNTSTKTVDVKVRGKWFP